MANLWLVQERHFLYARGEKKEQKSTQFYLYSSKEEGRFMLCNTANEKWEWKESEMMIKLQGKAQTK